MRKTPLILLFLAVSTTSSSQGSPPEAKSIPELQKQAESQLKDANFDGATKTCEEAVSFARSRFGTESSEEATFLDLMGQIYHSRKKEAKAAYFFKKAQDIREKHLASDPLALADTADHLTQFYFDQKKYKEAEAACEKALSARQAALSRPEASGGRKTNLQNLGRTQENLASIFYAQKQYAKAKPLFEMALATNKEALGEGDVAVAKSLENVADVNVRLKDYEAAQKMFEDALLIRKKDLEKSPLDHAKALETLATLYIRQGPEKYDLAMTQLELARNLREKAQGDMHIDVARTLNNMALIMRLTKRYSEAKPLAQKALQIRSKELGKKHKDTGESMTQLALIYSYLGRYEKASPLFTGAMKISEQTYGPSNSNTAAAANNLATAYHHQKKYAEAETLYKRSIGIWQKVPGNNRVAATTPMGNLAELYAAQHKNDLATANFKKSIDALSAAVDEDDERLVTAKRNFERFKINIKNKKTEEDVESVLQLKTIDME